MMKKHLILFCAFILTSLFANAQDVGVQSVDAPNNNCNAGLQTVTITIVNSGAGVVVGNIPVSYTFDGGAAVNETAPNGNLTPGATISYSFTTKVSIPLGMTAHTIIACTALGVDINAANNCKTRPNIFNYPPISSNTITANQTICTGSTPAAFAGSAPAGGNNAYTYQWEYSTTSSAGPFANALGASTSQNYTSPVTLTQTTWYRRVVSSAMCAQDFTPAVQVTVDQLIASNTITSAPQTICTGSTPAALSATLPTGGNGATYTYQWESSIISAVAGFSAAAGTNNLQNYTPGVLTQTTWYRRVVTSGVCASNTSATLQITVDQNIGGNTITADQTICNGSAPAALSGSLPTGGNGSSYVYQWEFSTTSAVAGFANVGGANSQNYSPGTLTQTTWYRRTVTSGMCASNISATIQITVNQPIASNTITADQTICTGSTPAALNGLSATGGDGVSFTYLWESSTTSAVAGFGAATGTNNGLNYSPASLTQTTWYRRIVTSGACPSSTSPTVQVTVNQVVASNSITLDQTICAGSTPASLTGTSPTGGNGTYVYQWESSTTSAVAGFSSASGVNNTQNYSPSALPQTTWYRRVVTAGVCPSNTSGTVQITVEQVIASNTIGTDQTICAGSVPSPLTGALPTGGNGTYTYLWESSTTSAVAGFASAAGTNNGQNYTPGAIAQTTWFRRVVNAGICAASTSATVQITTNSNVAGNTIGTDQTICSGGTPLGLTGSTPSGGTGTYVYLWESSTISAVAGFGPATGVNNNQNYNPGAVPQTTWFRRVVTSGACASNISATVQITATPGVASNTITADQTICTGSVPAMLNGSAPSGGTGTYVYAWESSTTSAVAGFGPASGVNNGVNYSPASLTQITWYRRVVSSGACPSNTSSTVQVTVEQNIASNTITSAPQTICTGSTPAALSATLPTGGNGATYTYQWESSIISAVAGFSAAAGTNNLQNYTPGVLTQTTWYRRVVTSGVCASNTSATLQITVDQNIGGNTITADQTICNGSAPAALSGSLPTGGNGSSYVYQWEFSTTSAVAGFANVGGANSQNYSPGTLTQTTWYRRTVTSGMCASNTSATVQVTTNQPIASNTITADQTICTGSTPAALNGLSATGGDGVSFTYLWESSTTSAVAGFGAATGTNNGLNYSPASLTQTTWYRRIVTSGACPSSTSPTVQVTVNQVVASNSITLDQTICAGSTPASLTGTSPTGGNGTYVYQWESSTTSAVAGFSSASGVNNTLNYSPSALPQTTWYRRVVTAGVCPSNTSGTVQITVSNGLANNTISADQTICSGTAPATLSGSMPTGGTSAYSFQWEASITNATGGFFPVPGATSMDYSPGALTQTTWYRRVVTSGTGACSSSTSSTLQITINTNVTSNTITADQTICSGTAPATLIGSTPSGGDGTNYDYQWESSTTSSTAGFTPVAGAIGQSYVPSPLLVTTWYRRVVSSGACPPDISPTVLITVNAGVTNNNISADQSICSGSAPSALTGSAPSGGTGSYSYQWESSTTSASAGFSPIAGGTSLGYIPGALFQTTWYRRVVTSGSGSCSSNASSPVQITVNTNVSSNTITADQTICAGTAPSPLIGSSPSGATGSYVYQWESSTTSAGAGFSPIPGATAQSYAPGVLNQTTWFRRVVISGPCPSNTSSAAQITVNPGVANNAVTADQSICTGSTPDSLVGTTPSGGTGSYVYQWEQSTLSAGAGYSVITGATGINYSPGSLMQTTWYRRVVTSGFGSCSSNTSVPVQITINIPVSSNTITADQVICSGTVPATLIGSTPSGGTGLPVYQWEISTVSAAAGFSAIAGATAQNYAPGAIVQTTWYRRVVTSGACPSDTSGTVQVTVNPGVSNNTIMADQTICANSSASDLIGSQPSGGPSYQWESSSTSGTVGFTSISGATSKDYSPGVLTQTIWFRRVASSGTGSCAINISAPVQITVNSDVISNNTIKIDQVICEGNTPVTLTGSNPAGGVGKYDYQWESSTTGPGAGFSAAAGSDSSKSYSPGALTQTTWFRRIVTGKVCGTGTSIAVQISVDPTTVGGMVNGATTVCQGSNAGALSLTGNVGTVVSWESSTDNGSSWSSISNTSATQNYFNLTLTTLYRAVLQSGVCFSKTSTVAKVSVSPIPSGGTVIGGTSVCSGTNGGILSLSGNVGNVVNWESSTDGVSWTSVSNTSTTLNFSNLTVSTLFRALVQSCNNTYSSITLVHVDTMPTPGNLFGTAQVCSSLNNGVITLSGYTGNVVRWESSTDNGNTWLNVSNISSTQNYNNLAATTTFRPVIQQGSCPAVSPAGVTVTVDPPTIPGTVEGTASVCSGTNSGMLNLTGFSGNILQWESSSDNGLTWSPIVNTTAALAYSNLTLSTQYRAVVQQGTCPSKASSIASLTVDAVPVAGIISGADHVECSGDNNGILSLTGYTGTISGWESSFDGGSSWNSIINNTSQQVYSGLSTSTLYKALVGSGSCSNVYAPVVKVTVNPKPVANFSSTNPNNKTISFANVSLYKNGKISGFSWSFGDNTSSDKENPMHTYQNSGDYSVLLKIVADNGCIDTVSHHLSVKFDEEDFLITNLVTLNDNGQNDVWYVENIEKLPSSEVHIFNRYGSEVFYASPYLNNWDCTYNGQRLPDGTYYYVLKVKNLNNIEKVYKGTITLVK